MPHILVVDDSAVDRRLAGELLRQKIVCKIDYAADGMEAMALIERTAPDLVVTDLTMPRKDGLELVTAIRTHWPEVPVILMTAYGSESLAIEALRQGAASYVPKSRLADRLANTVLDVLARAEADRSHQQLIKCLTSAAFSFSLDNEPALVDPLVDLVQQMVAGMSFGDFSGRLQIGVALREALLNALYHGNLELGMQLTSGEEDTLLEDEQLSTVERRRQEPPYRDRRIAVDVQISPSEARFVVRDQGPGFDAANVPDIADPGSLESQRGRGLWLMRTFMDEVTFNPPGNEVTLVKRRA